ncbi:MAG: DegV family protein [Lachnospiraceae bacterium]|nr:DegV family protein [Lachnospiraceae bacterium]
MATHNYTIVTDSATDMPKWAIEKYNLKVIPTPVVIDGKDYFDGDTIMPAEFYNILREGKNVTTYHINQYMFYTNFEPYAQSGEEVLYFCFSTGIAGTYNAANLAKEDLLDKYPDFKLDIMDSKCAAIGFGACVLLALYMKENGASKEEVMEATRFHFDHMEHIFIVDTLEYLYKGGRISRTSAIAGGLLDIKPIIEVTDEGKLEVFQKVRGRKKALMKLMETIGVRAYKPENQVLFIVHADASDDADAFIAEVKEKYGVKKIVKAFLGCAIGAHTGPGLIGACFLDSESPVQSYIDKLVAEGCEGWKFE